MDDIAQTFNTVTPPEYGGTGATTAIGGYDTLGGVITSVTAASTVDLTIVPTASVVINGNTTINSFGTTAAGIIRRITFNSTPTVTYGPAIIIPGGVSVTPSVGDVWFVESVGSGNWRVVNIQPVGGTPTSYREESFTPVLVGDSLGGTGTYTQQVGRLTKVGRLVHFQLSMAWTAHTGTGGMQIAGLPFVPPSGFNVPVVITTSSITFSGQLAAYVVPGNGNIVIYSFSSGSPGGGVPMDTSGSFAIAGSFSI